MGRNSGQRSALDQAVQRNVDAALRAVTDAIGVCKKAERERGPEGRRSAQVARDLSKVRTLLGSVRRLSPGYDTEDPDLMSEDLRASQAREKVVALREAKLLQEAKAQIDPRRDGEQ